jgi:DNA-binding LacI/PurR family transcriptional regulator
LYGCRKEVTIYDIARNLNISVATVSRAFKDDPESVRKTRKKIFDWLRKWAIVPSFCPQPAQSTH